MLLEAVDRPIRYRLADGREVRLVPGQPVDLPDLQADKTPGQGSRHDQAGLNRSAPFPIWNLD